VDVGTGPCHADGVSQLPWLGIEIRHLIALAAVDRARSFRGAADELGYVQSAVSQQIAQLERVVGCRLIDRARGGRHVSVTPAGALLLEHVDSIVGRLQAAKADVSAAVDGEQRTVRVGFAGALIARLLPPLTARLRTDAPGVRLVPVDAANDPALLELVDEGALDAAVVERPVSRGAYAHRELRPNPMVLLVHPSSPLAGRTAPLTAHALAGLPLIAVKGSFAQERALAWLREHAVPAEVVLEAESEHSAQAFVEAGTGVAIVPELTVVGGDDRVVALALEHLVPPRSLTLCWLRERTWTPALDAIAAAAVAVADELACRPRPPAAAVAEPTLAAA
jgi:DNA-binding transcriptional LysR family regulator